MNAEGCAKKTLSNQPLFPTRMNQHLLQDFQLSNKGLVVFQRLGEVLDDTVDDVIRSRDWERIPQKLIPGTLHQRI